MKGDSRQSVGAAMSTEEDYLARIRALEKANRILHRKLARSQTDRLRLEETNEKKEFLFRKVIQDLNRFERQLQSLMVGTAMTTGQNFFPALVSHIAETLNVSYALVTEKIDDKLQTLAFWADGALQSDFSYPLAKTPCEQTLREGSLYCEDSVQQRFPDNADLVQMGAESYLGIAMQDVEGQTIGSLCIIDSERIQNPQQAEQILRVFAARAAAELNRQRTGIALKQLNQILETRVEERTAALRASEAQIRSLIGAIPDLLLRVARDGTCLDYMQSHSQTGNFLPIRWHLSEILPPDLLERQLERIEAAIATNTLQVYEHQFKKLDHIVHEEVRISAISSDEVLIIVRDITDRQKAKQELTKLSRIASQTGEGVIITNANGQTEWVNAGFTRITGYQLSDLLGRKPGSVLQGAGTDPATVTQMRAALKRKHGFHVEILNYHKDGTPYWI
ncbi:MAG: PAS domain S-box protein, partial [Leptolyngbya sp. SIO1D8]|nr:PAS domain S-box protein [Leptolyngbya sp. SIO1D8]